ncbi:MAG: FG-GAP-like repeat-containing protein [Ferruginibacter sp.]
MKRIYLLPAAIIFSLQIFAQPSISSFTPVAGKVGDTVSITGNNFSTTATDNIIFFGAVKATVLSSTATNISAKVPPGAGYNPISVTVNGLTGYGKSFDVTFDGASSFSANTFNQQIQQAAAYSGDMLVSDFNGDGKPDIAMINIIGKLVNVFNNTSNSNGLSFGAAIGFATGNNPQRMIAADLDGDGMPDLAVTNMSANSFSVLKNTSSGSTVSFDAKIDFTTGAAPYGIAFMDADADGKPDIVVSNSTGNTVSVFKNTGTPGNISFAAKQDFTTGSAPNGITIADIDGDGKPDIAVVNNTSNTVSVLQNLSSAVLINFAAKADFATGTGPVNIAAADIDGDGKTDLAVANYGTNTISVMKNNSSGNVSFAAKQDYITHTVMMSDPPALARCIVVSDVDGDGKPDIVANTIINAFFATGTTSIFKNSSTAGTISLQPRYEVYSSYYPMAFCINDLDADSKPDMLSVSADDASVYLNILKNRVGGPIPVVLCPNGSIGFSSNVNGANYQWQVNNGTGFVNLANNSNYTNTNSENINLYNIPSSWYGYQYRCFVDGTSYSDIFSLKFENKWIGTGSNLWSTPARWSCGIVPDSNTDVYINSTVVVNVNSTIRSLTAGSNANITVNPGISLTVLH